MTIDQAAYFSVSGNQLVSSFCRQDLIRGDTTILTKETVPARSVATILYHTSVGRILSVVVLLPTKENVPWLVKLQDDLGQHGLELHFEVAVVSVPELRTTIICLYRSLDG
ncbi:hypothetical protein J6590_066876 [Homalodisca vitripennis]|nr:hypothetical protein J6590_066876 [Homalodisca vitripennis]